MSDSIHVSIDADLLDKAKAYIENISGFCAEAIREEIAKHEQPYTEAVYREVCGLLDQIEALKPKFREAETHLLLVKKSWEAVAILRKYDDVLELRDVSQEQLANVQFADSLVDVIRAKWPDLRCDMRELREYATARDAWLKEHSGVRSGSA